MKSNTDVFLTVWQSPVLKILAIGLVIYVSLSLLRNIGREFSDCGKCVANAADRCKKKS